MPSMPQIRAARALLGWSQTDLAGRCGLALNTVSRHERGATEPTPATMDAMQQALEAGGIEFIHRGVRRRPFPT